jgi:hypothetical protein
MTIENHLAKDKIKQDLLDLPIFGNFGKSFKNEKYICIVG